MERLDKTLEKMSREELLELKRMIQAGEAENIIQRRLEKFKNGNKVCPVCNTRIIDEGFTLVFGPIGFKKKATFDGLDCLEYFITKLKE